MTSLPSPVRGRKPLRAVQATGRLITGIGTGLADLFNDCAILEITDARGEETPYWCGAVADADGRVVAVRLQKFGTGERYQISHDGESWECDCPDSTYRGRDCKHLVALHDALTNRE
jgi:hypothetical protein